MTDATNPTVGGETVEALSLGYTDPPIGCSKERWWEVFRPFNANARYHASNLAAHNWDVLLVGRRMFRTVGVETMVDDVELKACPHCGTTMHQHEYCFSHPKPATGDCILRHYSFDNSKREAWNTRTPSPVSVEEAKDAKLIKRFTGWLNYVTSNSNRRVNEPSTEEYRRLIELASAALSARP